jgi:putrescine aminotransferase
VVTVEEDLLTRFGRYVNPGLARVFRFMGMEAVEATGEGAELVDEHGRRYLDCAAGYGVFVHGYRHPRIIAAAKRQLDRLPLSSRILVNRPMIELAELLAAVTPGDLQYTFFTNSGAESVEAALKFARAATGRTRLVATAGAFHGKTLGALSVSGRDLYQDPFRPLLPDVVRVPFGEADALADAVDDHTAAVIVEPIQGEGGVVVPPVGYLAEVRRICDDTGALWIADEVQTGMGRTGRLFAVEHEAVVPDLLCLAKGLGGGVVPLGAVVGRPRAWEFFDAAPLVHTSTFGGNPLASAVGAEAVRVAIDEDLPGQAARKGAWFLSALQDLASRFPDLVTEVRGRGLMIGMEFRSAGAAGAVIAELFQRQVLAVYTLNNERVIRMLPPLVITDAQLASVLERLDAAFQTLRAMELD